MLGAGMVVIQPSTTKIVLCYETKKNVWFLPKGRKDVGESLEMAALREAYEETGYRVEFLPLFTETRQPDPPGEITYKNTEPFCLHTQAWGPKFNRQGQVYDSGGEYLVFWYIGQIPADAIREEGTGMPDEQNYTSYLLSAEEALQKRLSPLEKRIIHYACTVYMDSLNHDARLEAESQRAQEEEALVPTLGDKLTLSDPQGGATSETDSAV